jgi:DNA-binding transcriptional MerR regulator
MRIGEFAACVGVTPRAVRHYESIGLLAPASTDPRTGYRAYGPDQLIRALRIEQLKQAGVPLTQIVAVLDDDGARRAVLEAHRRRLQRVAVDTRHQLALLDTMLATDEVISSPVLVTLAATPVLAAIGTATATTLGSAIRRGIQRQRRRARQLDPSVAWRVAARFPVAGLDPFPVETAAFHPAAVELPSTWLPGQAVELDVVGPLRLLPAAYDTLRAHLADRAWRPTGVVQETYAQLGPVPRTSIAVFVDAMNQPGDQAAGPGLASSR